MIHLLMKRIKELNAPVVVGLDPQLELIPQYIIEECLAKDSNQLKALAKAVLIFNTEIIDSIFDLVPAVKLQSAFYEQLGIYGIQAFQDTIKHARKRKLIIINDAKRGDIGSTSKAYANAYLQGITFKEKTYIPFDTDFITVNPYMGSDCVQPFIDACNNNNKGCFILVKTSNPSSKEFQDLQVDGVPLYIHVANKVNHWANNLKSFSNVCAVVGATFPKEAKQLREIMPHIFFLVPGYGAQGAKAKDLKHFFNINKEGAIISASRSIIYAYKLNNGSEDEFRKHARNACVAMIQDIQEELLNTN